LFSREELDQLRIVWQNEQCGEIDSKSPAVERWRREEVLPPQYYEQVGRGRHEDRERRERRDQGEEVQTLARMEKTTRVKLLGVPLIEVTRGSRWTKDGEILVDDQQDR
jgi:hypothetical protein